jgi:hypothetical protein
VIPDLDFRRESARMLAALTRVLGLPNLALAEDVVQDEEAARSFAEAEGRARNPAEAKLFASLQSECRKPQER